MLDAAAHTCSLWLTSRPRLPTRLSCSKNPTTFDLWPGRLEIPNQKSCEQTAKALKNEGKAVGVLHDRLSKAVTGMERGFRAAEKSFSVLRAIEEQDKPTTGRSKTVQAPKDQKEKSDSKDELKVESKAQDPSMEEIITPDMDVEEMVRKTEKMAKKLGATEKDVREAIEKVRDQQRRGLSAMEIEMEEPFMRSVVRGLEWVMYMLCIFGAFYSLNLITQGDVGRVLCGMLPTEMELIGATDYLNSFGTPGALDKST